MIDYEMLNNLIGLYFALGFVFLFIIIIVGLAIFVYFGMKINKLDDDNFKKRVKNVLKDKD